MAGPGSGSTTPGCQSCRMCRFKCDGVRPTCTRCREEGLKCTATGRREVKFVYHDASKQRRVKAAAAIKAATAATGPLNDTPLTKLDDSVMICHLKRVLYEMPPGDDGDIGDWVGFAAHNRPRDLAFHCLLSMSQSFYGFFRKAAPFAVRGRQLYGECLALVNRNLRDVRKQKTNDTLRSVVVLGAYELMSETDPMGWINHANGVAMLIQMRGVKACANREFFDLFRSNRLYVTLAALATSTSTFISDHEWIEKPWKLASVPKQSGDALLDILVDLPALNERRHKKIDISTVTSEALTVLDRLEQWWNGWKSLPSSRMSEVKVQNDPEGLKTWNTDISCVSLYAANSYAMYNATVILAIDTAVQSAGPNDLAPGSGEASQLLFKVRHAAMEICRIIDFHLTHAYGRMSELILIWPIRMAWMALGKGSSPEGRWLELRNEEINSRRGYWEVAKQTFHVWEPPQS